MVASSSRKADDYGSSNRVVAGAGAGFGDGSECSSRAATC